MIRIYKNLYDHMQDVKQLAQSCPHTEDQLQQINNAAALEVYASEFLPNLAELRRAADVLPNGLNKNLIFAHIDAAQQIILQNVAAIAEHTKCLAQILERIACGQTDGRLTKLCEQLHDLTQTLEKIVWAANFHGGGAVNVIHDSIRKAHEIMCLKKVRIFSEELDSEHEKIAFASAARLMMGHICAITGTDLGTAFMPSKESES